MLFEDADLIHSYSRADAIRDGVLIDVTQTAKEAGFKFPVALTAAVQAKYVVVPPGVECQDEMGRLWDVLTMLRFAIRQPAATVPRCASPCMFATTTATGPRRWFASRPCAAPATTASPSSPSCCPMRIEARKVCAVAGIFLPRPAT